MTIVGAPILTVAVAVFVLVGGPDRAESDVSAPGTEAPNPSPESSTSTTTVGAMVTSTSTTDPDHSTLPSNSPADEPGYGVGVHQVGSDISPGLYRVYLAWARLDADMDVIDNDLTLTGVSLMTVLDTDAFVELSGMAVPIDEMPAIDPIARGLTQGTYLVGADLEPGTYRITAEPGATAFAARLGPTLEVVEAEQHHASVLIEVRDTDFALRYTGTLERSP